MPNQRAHQKNVDIQDKIEVDFLCLHLSAIFGHKVIHVLRQSLTSFSVFTQGTRLPQPSTRSRHTFPRAISYLFSMKTYFNNITANPHHDFLIIQTRSKSFTLRKDSSAYLFFNDKRKMYPPVMYFDAHLFWRTFHFLQMYEATLFNLQHPSIAEVEWH